MASFWASRKKLAAACGEIPQARRASATPPGPVAVDTEREWDFPSAPPGAQPTLQGGGGHHPPRPTEELVPHHAKGAPSNGGTTMLGSPPRQRQRWERQHQSPYHPRLCVALPCPLIGDPRKMGVQGGDSMENEAQGPKFDLWLPPVPLWLLSGHPERSSPPQAAKYSRPGAPGAKTLRCCKRQLPQPQKPGHTGAKFP